MTGRLHDLLEDSARRHPERTAFADGSQAITYAALWERARRLSGGLRALGLRAGDRVAVVGEASPDQVAATYGVLGAGGVVVPLAVATRARSLRHALGTCGAAAAIVDAAALGHMPGPQELPSLRLVARMGEAPAGVEARTPWDVVPFEDLCRPVPPQPPAEAGPDDLAAIHFTSGTTGAPKGVMLTHRNMVSNVRAVVRYLELSPDDRVALALPVHYAYGSSVLHTHLAAGATVDAVGSMVFPVRVVEAIAARRCTGLSAVPSGLSMLLALDHGSYDLSSLRYVTQAGAPMGEELAGRVQRALPHARIFVMYGQTEATSRLTYLPPEELEAKPGSVGRPIDGVDIRVRGPNGTELPPGEVGEVVARGPGVMRGYWGDEEATARALQPDGLHTGDFGWMDRDGYLWIVGRRDELISRGGHRIGPGEIESVIASLPAVAEVAVVGTADPELGQAITAVVRPAEGASPDARRILAACARELPRHQLPSRLCLVERLLHTENGKLARARIRAGCDLCPSTGGPAIASCPMARAADDEGLGDP